MDPPIPEQYERRVGVASMVAIPPALMSGWDVHDARAKGESVVQVVIGFALAVALRGTVVPFVYGKAPVRTH